MPWLETEFDDEFKQWIEEFPEKELQWIYELLERYKGEKEIVIFRTRKEAEDYLEFVVSD